MIHHEDDVPPPPLLPTTARPPLSMIRGEGSWLWDDQGNRYLDFLQGWAVNALGHCPPEIVDALQRQAHLLLTPSPAFHNEPQLALADELTRLSGLDQVVFCNSGAEANELALKLVRKFGRLHKHGAHEVICCWGAFHGRTLATMAATGKPHFHELFPPNMPGFVHVPFGDVDAVREAITERTVAVMVEPIQGEAGVVVPPVGYLRHLRGLTEAAGLLLVLDEVQTGMGRTGTVFCHQQDGIRPDVMTLGKGLGSGVPISATLTTVDASCLELGDHGSTYGGNPLCCAVALAVTRAVSTPELLRGVRERGEHLCASLRSVARETGASPRGRGLLWALELPTNDAAGVAARCRSSGLLVNAAQPNVLRFAPSLRVTFAEIDAMVEILARALRASS